MDLVHTSDKDDATISSSQSDLQHTDPELGKVQDLEGYHQKEGVQDEILDEDLPEDQRRTLKDLIRRYPEVSTYCPEKPM